MAIGFPFLSLRLFPIQMVFRILTIAFFDGPGDPGFFGAVGPAFDVIFDFLF